MARPAGAAAHRAVLQEAIPLQRDQVLAGGTERDAEVGGDAVGGGIAGTFDILEDAAAALRQVAGELRARAGFRRNGALLNYTDVK